jgi:hypothetical protein
MADDNDDLAKIDAVDATIAKERAARAAERAKEAALKEGGKAAEKAGRSLLKDLLPGPLGKIADRAVDAALKGDKKDNPDAEPKDVKPKGGETPDPLAATRDAVGKGVDDLGATLKGWGKAAGAAWDKFTAPAAPVVTEAPKVEAPAAAPAAPVVTEAPKVEAPAAAPAAPVVTEAPKVEAPAAAPAAPAVMEAPKVEAPAAAPAAPVVTEAPKVEAPAAAPAAPVASEAPPAQTAAPTEKQAPIKGSFSHKEPDIYRRALEAMKDADRKEGRTRSYEALEDLAPPPAPEGAKAPPAKGKGR